MPGVTAGVSGDIGVHGVTAAVHGVTVAEPGVTGVVVTHGLTDFSHFIMCFKKTGLLSNVLGQYGQWKCVCLRHSKWQWNIVNSEKKEENSISVPERMF